jgi:uncharacterized protein (TIGR03437 family)
MKKLAWIVGWLAGSGIAFAQGPTVSPMVVPTFVYTMNSTTYPASQTVKVTLPASLSALPVVVQNIVVASTDCAALNVPSPCGWLAVTPDAGHAPLTLTVSVNPTGLTPGSYPGSFLVDTQPTSQHPVQVTVVLQISNPPSSLLLSGTNSPNYTAAAAGSAIAGSLAFKYTTGDALATPSVSELDVSSTGDIIPFNVTAANSSSSGSSGGSTAVWLRVSSKSPTQGAALTTSGSAGVGSMVPVFVTIDWTALQSLGIGQYFGTITIAATTNSKLSMVVSVSLVVSAGQPTVSAVFPPSLVPSPPVDPVFTIYGTNFTLNTSVYLYVGLVGVPNVVSYQVPQSQLVLVSPKILKATILAKWLPPVPNMYPYTCTIQIQNAGFPAQTGTFILTDPQAPSISLIVNAGSYLPLSKFVGTQLPDPAAAFGNPPVAVSPRGVISIFGQNLGPSSAASAIPVATGIPATPSIYTPFLDNMSVTFSYTDNSTGTPVAAQRSAPILMVSSNQINAIVPTDVATAIGASGSGVANVVVTNTGASGQSSSIYPVTVIAEDPGIFTFGGVGQGQGAIINYDANSAATINSATNEEPVGNVIAIFVTGLGQLQGDSSVPDGALTSPTAAPIHLLDESNVRITIEGQPAVVLYAGTSPGAVAGLVQVNAIVPPTSTTAANAPITLTIGDKTITRQAQTGVTLGVKVH